LPLALDWPDDALPLRLVSLAAPAAEPLELEELPMLLPEEPLELPGEVELDEPELPGELLDPLEVSDEVWACAASTRHAAQNAVTANNLFFIILPLLFLLAKRKRHHSAPFYTFANLASWISTLNRDRTQFPR
jgi:hypothetical protein